VWYDGVDSNCDGVDDFDQDQDGDPIAEAGGGDCDDLDASRSSLIAEVWYDGIDSNCDGLDDFDQDGDGVIVPDDCDDLDPTVTQCPESPVDPPDPDERNHRPGERGCEGTGCNSAAAPAIAWLVLPALLAARRRRGRHLGLGGGSLASGA
jgi:hypothetical protein